MTQVSKKSVMSGFIWIMLEKIGAQGITFIVSVILARILDPDVYGTVAIVTVFNAVLGVFVDSGTGTALIQKKDADEIDFSSVFYMNIAFCLLLYLFMFCVSPLIAAFYENENLTMLIRVMCIGLIIGGVKNVQQAYVSKNMLFKRFFFATLGGTVISAVIGVAMAYRGYGVWALAAQNLINQTVDTIILWITVKWRPKLLFSFSRIKKLFSFGLKLMAASLISVVYVDLRQLIIGKIYSTDDLAYYNRGISFPKLFAANINGSLSNVMFPVMARQQDNLKEIKRIVRNSILVNAYIIFPIMMGLGVCSNQLVRVILTEKWLMCTPYLRVFCIEYSLFIFNSSNQNAIQAIGRSGLYLRNDVLTKIISLIVLFATMRISVYATAIGSLITALLSSYIYAHCNKKLISYGFLEQLKDLIPNVILTVIMGVMVYTISLFGFKDLTTLIIQVFTGIAIYIIGSMIMKLEAYKYLSNAVKSYFAGRINQ